MIFQMEQAMSADVVLGSHWVVTSLLVLMRMSVLLVLALAVPVGVTVMTRRVLFHATTP